MSRITITLSDEEKTALRALAEKEFRDPRAQATLIIRRELERQGFITNPASKQPAQDHGAESSTHVIDTFTRTGEIKNDITTK